MTEASAPAEAEITSTNASIKSLGAPLATAIPTATTSDHKTQLLKSTIGLVKRTMTARNAIDLVREVRTKYKATPKEMIYKTKNQSSQTHTLLAIV